MPDRARALVEQTQSQWLQLLGLGEPEPLPPHDDEYARRYVVTDPDQAEPPLPRHDPPADRPDLGALSRSRELLASMVDKLKSVIGAELGNVCFGTIPGGGLDAYSQRVPDCAEYAICVPDGLFTLINLVARLVAMLQPFEQSENGLYYPANAQLRQFELAQSPQVQFRARDLLSAYFLHGDPNAALPHRRAVPHEGRFVYLLEGTELFVFAHEAAHVVLGHLHDEQSQLTTDHELAADAFALAVVTDYLGREYPEARARAELAGYLFHALNMMWERIMIRALGSTFIGNSGNHPPAEDRLSAFAAIVRFEEWPPWAQFVLSAIDLATGHLPETFTDDLIERGQAMGGFSARVAPWELAHLLRDTTVDPSEQWMNTVIELLCQGRSERLIGLWYLDEHFPISCLTLYEGLDDDDEARQELCGRALISIEPLYENYLPRLRENFREADQQDDLGGYQMHVSSWIRSSARLELGERRIALGPSHPGFYL
jgi:hypothetical protein